MTTEPGSDELFATIADTSEIGRRARRERAARALEEWHVCRQPTTGDEPGADYPDRDEAPPADEPHPEFDPLPPPAPRG